MRCRILVGLIFYILLADSVMAIVRWITNGLTPVTIILLVAIPVFASLLFIFRISGSRKLTGDMLVILCIAVISLTAWRDGGLYSRTIFWFPVLPLVASFLAGKVRFLWVTLICWSILLAMFFAHHEAWLPVYDELGSLVGRLSAAMATVLFVAIISFLYEDSYHRAEQERKQLDKSKSNWLAMVSHELRTPLTSIYGSLKLMTSSKNGDANHEGESMLKIAYSNSERLMELINDVLDIEKIESGQLKLNKTRVDLVALIREVHFNNVTHAKQKEVCLDLDVPSEEAFIVVDAGRFIQVLENIISNALKFAPSDSVVKIKLRRFMADMKISVADSGPGISEDFHDKIFTRFAQSEDLNTREYNGSGLGLFISKMIIEKHGGKISYKNNKEAGVTFFFTLPLTTETII